MIAVTGCPKLGSAFAASSLGVAEVGTDHLARIVEREPSPPTSATSPTRHNYGLALWHSHFERILAGWVAELGIPILRGCEVVGFAQDDTGVDVQLSGDTSLRRSTSSGATEDAA